MRIPLVFSLLLVVLLSLSPATSVAQGTAHSLTIEGMDKPFSRGARATAMGGVGVAAAGGLHALFVNPAALSMLTAPEVRVGGAVTMTDTKQEQDWIPNRFYPNLSLLMEDMLAGIKDPEATDPRDMLQRPFDDLRPDWESGRTRVKPTLVAAALPLEIGGMPVVVGAGFHQAVNLDHFYQNNTIMDPNLGLYRPAPLPVVTGQDSLYVRWYAYRRERLGAVNGFTASASCTPVGGFSFGAMATYYHGTSEDLETATERGAMTFYYDSFRLDQAGMVRTTTGTSTYTGLTGAIGLHYKGAYFSVGGTVKLPLTMTREWERTGPPPALSSLAAPVTETGSDKIHYPAVIAVGFALTPTEAVTVAADVTLRAMNDVEYTPGAAATLSPWLEGNLVHLGAEYRATPWLWLRGGYRTEVQVFAPAGAGLIDEPARGSAYSAGIGLAIGQLGFDLAYEYFDLKYLDKWETNVNTNAVHRHLIQFETSLRF